jgi:hypothetical protein
VIRWQLNTVPGVVTAITRVVLPELAVRPFGQAALL